MKLEMTIDSKAFKSYADAFKSSCKNMSAPIKEYSDWHEDRTKQRWESGLDYQGKSFAPLAPSTLLLKQNNQILIESRDMINSLKYKPGTMELTYGISDPKYGFHHDGTSRMPQRRIISEDKTDGREKLVEILRRYFKRVKSRRRS